MRIVRSRLFFLLILSVLLAILVSGCALSKKGYQEALTEILSDTKKQLAEVSKKREQPANQKQGTSQSSLDKQEIDVLKETLSQINAISPPDEFFSGHADLIQFLDLYIKGKELAIKAQPKGQNKPGTQQPPFGADRTESIKMIMGANRALGRAARELPFMEFDLLETFGQLAGGGPGQVPQQAPVSPIRPPSN